MEASTDEGKAAIMSTFDAFDPSFGTQFQGYLDSLATDQMNQTTYVRNQNQDGTYAIEVSKEWDLLKAMKR